MLLVVDSDNDLLEVTEHFGADFFTPLTPTAASPFFSSSSSSSSSSSPPSPSSSSSSFEAGRFQSRDGGQPKLQRSVSMGTGPSATDLYSSGPSAQAGSAQADSALAGAPISTPPGGPAWLRGWWGALKRVPLGTAADLSRDEGDTDRPGSADEGQLERGSHWAATLGGELGHRLRLAK